MYRCLSLYRCIAAVSLLYRQRYSRALSARAVNYTARICCIGGCEERFGVKGVVKKGVKMSV